MNKMSLNYLCFGSLWRNLTSPMTHWNRGTAVQIDAMNDHPEMQVVIGQLGTDMVVLTMAARITQSIFTLVRNLLHRRPLGWKIIPKDWKSKAFEAVLWMCWNIINVFLAVEVTNVLIYKNMSKHSTHTGQSMNTISIKCHWSCKAELNKQNMVPEKELPSPRMEILQRNSYMEEDCDHEGFSDMDIMVSKETLLPSCTNPFILSMICVPSEDGESLSPSEQSDLSEGEFDGDSLLPCEETSLSESESEDEETEKDSSIEDTSVDSGMQESWTTKSKEDMDESEEESDWSDEETDSWDEASDTDCSRDDDLWDSFCRNDDPYNPLSFTKPTRSPKSPSIADNGGCQTLKCTMKPQARKPVLSRSKCSNKCASQIGESDSYAEVKKTKNPGVKKVAGGDGHPRLPSGYSPGTPVPSEARRMNLPPPDKEDRDFW